MLQTEDKPVIISKSKYIAGLQCPKLLWYNYNRKQDIPEVDSRTQAIFDFGHDVGELAQKLFPNGITIEWFKDPEKMIVPTQEAMEMRVPVFEPAMKHGHGYAIADILVPVASNQWDLIEVKSSTKVKDVNLHDVAIQLFVFENNGVQIRRCKLMHINNQYIRKGDIQPDKLFITEDITDAVKKLSTQVEPNLEKMVNFIQMKECPDIKIGPQCSDPYGCALTEICWGLLPELNVFSLYRDKSMGFELYKNGILKLQEIPASEKLSSSQAIQVKCARTGKPHVEKESIAGFLSRLEYPLYFLDFETIAAPIPLYDGSRPWQQVPFQFSLHVLEKPGMEPMNHSFLADGEEDPRPKLLEKLKSCLAKKGSVVAYKSSFETSRLDECAGVFTEYKEWVESVKKRVIDLLIPFSSFYYYHPDQDGTASLKAVLPALTGKGYGEMEIADGGEASLQFERITFNEVDDEEKKKVRKQLEEYCGLDTEGMIWIIESLKRLIL